MPYVASTKLYAYSVPGDDPNSPMQCVIGRNVVDAASKVPNSTSIIRFVGTLLITGDDMHVVFDPPPEVQVQPAVHDLLEAATPNT